MPMGEKCFHAVGATGHGCAGQGVLRSVEWIRAMILLVGRGHIFQNFILDWTSFFSVRNRNRCFVYLLLCLLFGRIMVVVVVWCYSCSCYFHCFVRGALWAQFFTGRPEHSYDAFCKAGQSPSGDMLNSCGMTYMQSLAL